MGNKFQLKRRFIEVIADPNILVICFIIQVPLQL